MWDFGDRLPVRDARNIVSLGEGMTPLLSARSFPERAVFWKNEGASPTGSQKDRAVSVAISVAREHGFERVVTASTGDRYRFKLTLPTGSDLHAVPQQDGSWAFFERGAPTPASTSIN